jgi:His-Xaa-Ser system radical SAM maturase HxsB
MGVNTTKKVVDMIFQTPSPNIKIEFQGGEPLLNWDAIQSTIEHAEEKNRKHGKKLEFVICTNLTTIDKEKLNYIKDRNVNISTSLDGPKFVNDQNRLLRVGESSYELFVKNLDLARNVIGADRISALMTTTKFSLSHMREIIDEYVRLGFTGIFIRALNPYGFAWKDYDTLGFEVEEFLEGYYDALDYIIALNARGEWFPEYYATLLLTRILTPFSTGFVDLQSPSGAGISGVIYDYNGDVYPADEARMLARMGDRKFLMGDVKDNDYHEIFNGSVIRNIVSKSCVECMPGCFSCAFQIYCGVDPIRNYVEQDDIVGHRPTSSFCQKNENLIRNLLMKLKENDPKIMDVFWSWITNRPINRVRCEVI